jgi:hypothetical protein
MKINLLKKRNPPAGWLGDWLLLVKDWINEYICIQDHTRRDFIARVCYFIAMCGAKLKALKKTDYF